MTLVAVIHVLPVTTIVRERRLPIRGTVRAHVGQKVNSTDIVADARWARDHTFIDVGRELAVSAAAADRLIRVKAGDRIAAGMVVARGSGLLPKAIKIPRTGRVIAAGAGQILIEGGEVRLELRAGIPGLIKAVMPDRGVQIETTGALIQGVWGNGRVDSGMLINLADKPDAVLAPERFDVSMRGMVIAGGQILDRDTLRAASEAAVKGLVLGGLSPLLLPLALEMQFPIVVTDGFAGSPMNSAAHRLITTNDKRVAVLNAEAMDRQSGARSEVIIPLPSAGHVPEPDPSKHLATGDTVRCCMAPAPGLIGSVVSLPVGLSAFPSGLKAEGAEVRFENGQQMLVPLVNLEVVG